MRHGRSSWSPHSHGSQGWFVPAGTYVLEEKTLLQADLFVVYTTWSSYLVQVGDDQFGRDAIQNFKDNKVNVCVFVSVMTM